MFSHHQDSQTNLFLFSWSTLQRGTISFDPAHHHKRVTIGGWRLIRLVWLEEINLLSRKHFLHFFFFFLVFRDFLIAEAIKMLSPGTVTYIKPSMLLRVILVTRWCKIRSWLLFSWAILKIDPFKFEQSNGSTWRFYFLFFLYSHLNYYYLKK